MISEPLTDATFHLLGIVRAAAACREPWERLLGDARVRWCPRCQARVYRLEGLNVDEARALLRRSEAGRVCTRFYRREDGAFLVVDRRASSRWARRLRTPAKVLALTLLGLLLLGAGAVTLFGDNIRRALGAGVDDYAGSDEIALRAARGAPQPFDSKCGCGFRHFDYNNAY